MFIVARNVGHHLLVLFPSSFGFLFATLLHLLSLLFFEFLRDFLRLLPRSLRAALMFLPLSLKLFFNFARGGVHGRSLRRSPCGGDQINWEVRIAKQALRGQSWRGWGTWFWTCVLEEAVIN